MNESILKTLRVEYAKASHLTPAGYEPQHDKGLVAVFEASQPRWISVGERLPELGVRVIGLTLGRVQIITNMYLGGWLTDLIITHWMPLPAPPQDKESEV